MCVSRADVHAGVVAGGLDPVDVRDIQKYQFAAAFDRQALHALRRYRRVVRNFVLGPAQGADEARVVEWLQQVVECSRLERAQRVVFVSGHKDDRRRQVGAEQLKHVEAVAFGHLHVEKHQIVSGFLHRLDRFWARLAFDDGADVGIAAQ